MSNDSIEYLPLEPEDEVVLKRDRDFLLAVLEARFPHLRLDGSVDDLFVLQEVVQGGPYSDDPMGEVIALGTALGDVIANSSGMSWIRYSDEEGVDLALRYENTSIVVFPRSMILKRIERDERLEIPHIHDGVCHHVRELVARGDCQ
jgi:hypothetical protein